MSSPNPEHPSTAKADVKPPPAEAAPIAPSAIEPPHKPIKAPAKRRRWWQWGIAAVVLICLLIEGIPWAHELLTTESTDDAYVNGHVTFVAPRVGGQVLRVLVDDNNRVRKGDVLVQLDPEPYQVQEKIAESVVAAAEADLDNARAQARSSVAQARSMRFSLDRAMEDVDNQIALLKSKVATVDASRAVLNRAQADYDRAIAISKANSGAIATSELDRYKQVLLVSQSELEESLQGVYQLRVALGLPPKPASGNDLTQVPDDLDETFSSVRQAQASLVQAISQLGVLQSFNQSPKEMIAEFYKRDPSGDIDRIYAKLLLKAPAVLQAESKLAEAKRKLDEAKLNLKYCDVVSEIDGVVTRRNVNPGNNVIPGQSLMAVRSLKEIWIDANFKETQLADLRIGQPVDLDVDMYGSSKKFEGRISGFTMGTGSTLALLPAENATGNFVKVVQRVPVRIELLNYDPETAPLIFGTSVTATVHYKEAPQGPNAGKTLQPYLSSATTEPTTEPITAAYATP